MELIATSNGRHLLLQFHGELDHHGAGAALRQLEYALDSALPLQLMLDFSGVTFMDSSGIAIVIRAQKRMVALGGTMQLCHVPPQAQKVFDAAGISRIVKIVQEENEIWTAKTT